MDPREPFFSVLTHEEFRGANLTPQARERFFRSGENHVQAVMDFVAAHIEPQFTASSVLEFGCGPGRLALAFARRFASVTAVDHSPAMLAKAREMAERAGLENIEFREELPPQKFDIVSCQLVLQRLPRREGLALLRRLLGSVGSVGIFHLPVRDRASSARKAVRWTRTHVPLANAAIHALRRSQFQRTTFYDLGEVLALVHEAGFDAPLVSLSDDGDFDAALVYVHRPRTHADEPAEIAAAASAGSTFIDVRELIARTSIEELNATAEGYFSSLTDWEHHLAKPFAKPDDAPAILANLAVLLQGLQLSPGLTVLDYGAGTGWLSRFVTQLGCRSILMDVSPSALRIAKETFAKIGIIGERPEPRFLVFDGHRIDLPDESVDRIVCFDAFHHAPNPAAIIAEFARVLRPGGIAGFAEPGPHHSKTPQSQFEMRTYGVLENDIDLPAIWHAAEAAGFTDLRVAAWNGKPFHTTLAGYEDLLARGATLRSYAESSREFMQHVRNFYLTKGGGTSEGDSRHPAGLLAEIVARVIDETHLEVTVTNVGQSTWLPSSEAVGGVSVSAHLYDEANVLRQFDFCRAPLSDVPLRPNDSATVTLELKPLPPGRYRMEFDCVAERVTWFTQVGSHTTFVRLAVTSGG
ncbi:MAG TPA: methyltransferase domain-containing protein [Thermoanaerobaculia bacterium]|jgi:ubiquinone/menaquinone biosynthesis C-methylase UbiE